MFLISFVLLSLLIFVDNLNCLSAGRWNNLSYQLYSHNTTNTTNTTYNITGGALFLQRLFPSGAMFPHTNEFLVFGGRGDNGVVQNTLFSINLTSLICLQVGSSPLRARQLSASTSDLVSGDFYIHGGLPNSNPYTSLLLHLIMINIYSYL
jgi:hypothetical protein